MRNPTDPRIRARSDRNNLTMLGANKRALYQPSLWGDTYLTPQEAAVYINQMLMTLKQAREKKHGSRT